MLRKYILVLLASLLLGNIQAQNLQANLSFSRFYNPELGSYIETYLSVNAAGLKLIEVEEGKYQASVNLVLMFKNGEKIVEYSKTQLNSPIIDDTSKVDFNFLDQQRFFLNNGKYVLDIEFQDANSTNDPTTAIANVDLLFTNDSIQLSDVEFLSSYTKSKEWKVNTKNGYDMVPYISTFFPESETEITYYAELYNAEKVVGENQEFLLTAYISDFSNEKEIVNELIIRRKMEAKEVNVILSKFDLTGLASGNYFLNLEVRSRENKVLTANKSFFQVSNPKVIFNENLLAKINADDSFVKRFSNDSLAYLIQSVYPIATPVERTFISKTLDDANKEQRQKFLAFFWESRDSKNPEYAWKKYQVEVIKTNNSFGNKYLPGFATDRGRVYLQYGSPNTIADQEYESGGGMHNGAVPYQIWHYYEIGNQRDGKFVFYNPHLIPNGYDLLHSNVVGEVSNPHWQSYLHRDQLESIDPPDNDRYYGRSGELYNDPR
ncbi:MAG: GWxTD domain-containing protein [Bacteroidales bacterium]|nr:GWxTD domain-containing protein [Bacteroidales bacterium]